MQFNPPRVPDVDDVTGEPLIQRDDDCEETVRDRLNVYHEQTHPLVDHYQESQKQTSLRYICVDGLGDVQNIQKKILSELQTK